MKFKKLPFHLKVLYSIIQAVLFVWLVFFWGFYQDLDKFRIVISKKRK